MFSLGMPFQPNLMFVGNVSSLTKSAAAERCFTWLSSGLTQKHSTRLEKLARVKLCSLLRILVNYGRKMFYRCHCSKSCFVINEGTKWDKVFGPCRRFLLCLMLEGKAGAYLRGPPFRCFTLGLAPGLGHKH
jgi:hypothetical protein